MKINNNELELYPRNLSLKAILNSFSRQLLSKSRKILEKNIINLNIPHNLTLAIK